MYPFGFGLTYGDFAYGEIKADKFEISLKELENGKKLKLNIDVTNNGEYAAKETVQLYICDKVASVMRPIKELKAYTKKEIKPCETASFDFELGYNDLGFYLKNGEYIVEKGEFDIFIGENCLTNRKITISVN